MRKLKPRTVSVPLAPVSKRRRTSSRPACSAWRRISTTLARGGSPPACSASATRAADRGRLPRAGLGRPSAAGQKFRVSLPRRQIETSPPFDSDRPVSRRVEVGLYDYYGWSPYWAGDPMPPLGYLAGGPGAGFLFPPRESGAEPVGSAGYKPGSGATLPDEPPGDPQLYTIAATPAQSPRPRAA